ncbi:putative nuclease HARBI1 [Haliotis cracherodii]|uniref:putative nuclease HARBI1 n=1 Tax=Haliotis cracherodii TaxID=6455 RepID=UPI0039EA66AA
MEEFHQICGFPKVLGCIDCTLIPIQRAKVDEVAYVSRKGYHAVNVQAVCDAKLRFTNVVVLWPGATHDAHIYNNCSLKRALEEEKPDGWLLGDSGYACKPHLLTPVLNPANSSEERYNRAHIGTRNTIERAFGVCKSRFRCLHKSSGCLLFEPEKCIAVITACMQLHNLAVSLRLPVPHDTPDTGIGGDENHTAHQQAPSDDGNQIRRLLIQSRFSSMTKNTQSI